MMMNFGRLSGGSSGRPTSMRYSGEIARASKKMLSMKASMRLDYRLAAAESSPEKLTLADAENERP